MNLKYKVGEIVYYIGETNPSKEKTKPMEIIRIRSNPDGSFFNQGLQNFVCKWLDDIGKSSEGWFSEDELEY